jgi:hypothetical protein
MKRTANNGKNRRRATIAATWDTRVANKGMIIDALGTEVQPMPEPQKSVYTKDDAMVRANAIVARYLKTGWPENKWVAIGKFWQVNLFTDTGKPYAILYPKGEVGLFNGTQIKVNQA